MDVQKPGRFRLRKKCFCLTSPFIGLPEWERRRIGAVSQNDGGGLDVQKPGRFRLRKKCFCLTSPFIGPIPHIAVVEKLIEALSFRQIGVMREEYAVSSDGMKMFGVMDLSSGFEGCRFAIGLRNSHDKSFRLSCTVGLRIFVCENLAFHGEYTP